MAEKPKKKPFDPNVFMQGISAVESGSGQFMMNPTSSATGLYGQLYKSIDPAWLKKNNVQDRNQFAGDTALQNNYMRQRISGDMSNTGRKTNLFRDAEDLYKEYSPDLRKDEIAALAHFLGRQGAREYLGYVLRDNTPEKFKVPGINKSPEEYLNLYNEAIGDQTLPGRDSFKLQKGGTIMAKKKKGGDPPKDTIQSDSLKLYNEGRKAVDFYNEPYYKTEIVPFVLGKDYQGSPDVGGSGKGYYGIPYSDVTPSHMFRVLEGDRTGKPVNYPIYKKPASSEKLQGGGKVGVKDGQLKSTYDVGTPLHQIVNIPSDYSDYAKLAATQGTKDQLNRYRWANFHGNMVDYPAGQAVQSFQYTPNMLNEMKARGLTREYIESYQPANYETTLSQQATADKWRVGPPEMEELGLGSWIKDNIQGVVGGLKTIAGGVLSATGMGAAIGVPLMVSGVSDIAGEIKGDKAAKLQEEGQAELLAEQEGMQFDAMRAGKSTQLQGIADQNSNYMPKQMQYGGPINYTGQSHQGPQQGIPVDAQGNSIAITNKEPMALVEGGEIAFNDPDTGQPYVMPKDTAPQVTKVFKRAEARLGKDFNNPDPISKEGLERSLRNFIASNEALKKKKGGGKVQMKSGGSLPKNGPGDFIGPENFDYNSLVGSPKPWSPFPTQAAISGISAGLGALGNVITARNMKEPEDIVAPRVSAPRISLAEQRIQADVDAAEARGRTRGAIRRSGASKAEGAAAQGVVDARITGETGRNKAQSLMQERNINRQAPFQAQAQNQQAVGRARQLNAIRQDQFNQQQSGLYSQAFNNVAGGVRDIGSAYQDSQYLSTLGGRSGYQMMRDVDGKVKLMPIPGHWENRVQDS